MDIRKKPTRIDLLRVLDRLQYLVGHAIGTAHDDRNPCRLAVLVSALNEAHDLCIDARGFDDPVTTKSSNGWNFDYTKRITGV